MAESALLVQTIRRPLTLASIDIPEAPGEGVRGGVDDEFHLGFGGSVDDDDVDVELACDVEFGSVSAPPLFLVTGTSMWWSVSSCRSESAS